MRKSLPVWLVIVLASVLGGMATQAQTTDLLLGFNDAAGSSAAQNDYVIDLGIGGSNLVANATANGGSVTFTNIISVTTFNTAFSSDGNALNEVAAGIVGGNSLPTTNPKQLFITCLSLPGTINYSQFNDAVQDAQTPTIGEYPSVSSSATANWSEVIAASPTEPGTEPSGTSVAAISGGNPMGTLSSGILTLNLFENTETSGTHPTVKGWVQVGVFNINVNTHTVKFSLASSSPAPTISSVGSGITNGFSPLTVVFTNSASGSITDWVWNFGNGNIITNTTGASVTNTYTSGGNYTVTLTVYGPGGSNTLSLASYIVASPTPKISETLAGNHFILSGTNCPIGVPYRILNSTNVALPLANWQPVFTNAFLNDGSFAYTNSITNTAGFFQLVSP